MTNDGPKVVLKGGVISLGMEDGTWPSFCFEDLQEITAKETPDFFGGTITFEFALKDGTVYLLYEGIKGMSELFPYMWHEHGINLNVPYEEFTKKDVVVYRGGSD